MTGPPPPALGEALGRAARSGVALVLVDHLAVAPAGRVTPEDLLCLEEGQVALWRELLADVRASGPDLLVAARLVHAGPRGATLPRRHGLDLPLPAGAAWPLLAASALPYSTVAQIPQAMDDAAIAAVVDHFGVAASRAAEAGFDALELQFGHGYLLGSFLSPLTNQRRDEYGGDVHGRLGVPLRVLDAVRAVWPAGQPLVVAISVSDAQAGGTDAQDAVVIARELQAHGADAVHALSGQTTVTSAPVFEPRFNAEHSDLVRNGAGVPAVVSGHLPTVDDVNHLVLAGRADLCVLGLPLGRPPSWFDRDPDEMVPASADAGQVIAAEGRLEPAGRPTADEADVAMAG